jgi:hypothetical protein
MFRTDAFIADYVTGLCAAVVAVMISSLQENGANAAPPGSPPR